MLKTRETTLASKHKGGFTSSGKHAVKEYHTIKWEHVEVMNHSHQYRQRYTLEAWHIQSEQHKMNRDESFFQQCTLLAIYYIHPHTSH